MGGIGSGIRRKNQKRSIIQIDRLEYLTITESLIKDGRDPSTVNSLEVSISGVISKVVKVKVAKQPRHFGGYQYFFHCPNCDRPCRKLRIYHENIICQRCLSRSRCRYSSQRMGRLGLAKERLRDLLGKLGLGTESAYVDYVEQHAFFGGLQMPEKPPRMRWTTYSRLSEEWATSARIVAAAHYRQVPRELKGSPMYFF